MRQLQLKHHLALRNSFGLDFALLNNMELLWCYKRETPTQFKQQQSRFRNCFFSLACVLIASTLLFHIVHPDTTRFSVRKRIQMRAADASAQRWILLLHSFCAFVVRFFRKLMFVWPFQDWDSYFARMRPNQSFASGYVKFYIFLGHPAFGRTGVHAVLTKRTQSSRMESHAFFYLATVN